MRDTRLIQVALIQQSMRLFEHTPGKMDTGISCYDCMNCYYETYGKNGDCMAYYPDPPLFEDLDARYAEWEEPAGAFPQRQWKSCPHFKLG